MGARTASKGGCRCECGAGCDCGCDCACGCCGCACGEQQGFRRRHQTKAEQVAALQQYLKDLRDEVQAVEEKLADLKRKR